MIEKVEILLKKVELQHPHKIVKYHTIWHNRKTAIYNSYWNILGR